jgi:hypothetical protein
LFMCQRCYCLHCRAPSHDGCPLHLLATRRPSHLPATRQSDLRTPISRWTALSDRFQEGMMAAKRQMIRGQQKAGRCPLHHQMITGASLQLYTGRAHRAVASNEMAYCQASQTCLLRPISAHAMAGSCEGYQAN